MAGARRHSWLSCGRGMFSDASVISSLKLKDDLITISCNSYLRYNVRTLLCLSILIIYYVDIRIKAL
jgi:hypothetical protein